MVKVIDLAYLADAGKQAPPGVGGRKGLVCVAGQKCPAAGAHATAQPGGSWGRSAGSATVN